MTQKNLYLVAPRKRVFGSSGSVLAFFQYSKAVRQIDKVSLMGFLVKIHKVHSEVTHTMSSDPLLEPQQGFQMTAYPCSP